MRSIQSPIFDNIVNDLRHSGYSIQKNALPAELSQALAVEVRSLPESHFQTAGVGRHSQHQINRQVRRDKIQWLDDTTPAQAAWLAWMTELKGHLNQHLYLGLDFYESHYAYYARGAFYQRHVDAFQGKSNRVLSTVTYLNEQWDDSDGGQLRLYESESDTRGIEVIPSIGTLVIFMSEEFPHEVMPANQERYSIAGWFRRRDTL